jgi:hypothetical protein
MHSFKNGPAPITTNFRDGICLNALMIDFLYSTADVVRTSNKGVNRERRSRVPDSYFVKCPSCYDASQAPEQVRFSQILKLQIPRVFYRRITIRDMRLARAS